MKIGNTGDNDGEYHLIIDRTVILSPVMLLNSRFVCQSFTGSFDIRVSLYRGEYKGVYAPYVVNGEDFSNYANGLQTIVSSMSTQVSLTSSGLSSVTEQITEIHNGYRDWEDTKDYVDSYVKSNRTAIEQMVDKVSIQATATESYANQLGTQYKEEVGTHFAFGTDGLDIYPISSSRVTKAHLDSDSLEFTDSQDTTYAWLDASEGVGGKKLSLGDPDNRSKRWLVSVQNGGEALGFYRGS